MAGLRFKRKAGPYEYTYGGRTLKCALNCSRVRCWGGKNSRRRSSSRAFLSSATRSSMLSVARKSEKKSVTNARMVPWQGAAAQGFRSSCQACAAGCLLPTDLFAGKCMPHDADALVFVHGRLLDLSAQVTSSAGTMWADLTLATMRSLRRATRTRSGSTPTLRTNTRAMAAREIRCSAQSSHRATLLAQSPYWKEMSAAHNYSCTDMAYRWRSSGGWRRHRIPARESASLKCSPAHGSGTAAACSQELLHSASRVRKAVTQVLQYGPSPQTDAGHPPDKCLECLHVWHDTLPAASGCQHL